MLVSTNPGSRILGWRIPGWRIPGWRIPGRRIVLCAFLCPLAVAQGTKPQFSFGVLADVQYADKATSGSRHYRTSLERLKDCVADLNRRDLAFVIQHGDFIDAGKDSFDAVLPVWRRISATRRNVIGNHDLPFLRKQVLAKLGMQRGYYHFDVANWRFVALDGMDVSLHGYPRGHAKRKAATKMLAALKSRKAKHAQPWNGGIGKEQIEWLRSTLQDAARRGQRVVLHCHFPILAKASSDYHLLWNHAEVLALIEKFPCVAAWFNGHDHAGGYAEQNGIHHVTFAGMVEAPKRNAYGVVDVFANRLVIRGVGKQDNLDLRLRATGTAETPKRRPNILWISCEDISPHVGCYGDKYAVTPNIDALAKQGVLYERAFATIGVCAPARSTIITGMYPPSIGTHHMRCSGKLPKSVRCFPELLREAGYYCTNKTKTDYNFKHGKNVWDASNRKAHWRNRKDGQPFFAVVNLTICHESKIRLPEKQYANRTKDFTAAERHDPAKAEVPPYHPDTPEVRKDWARYADMITLMDKQAGRILKELEADGLAGDTIVVFFSDHGAGMPRSKRWLYDSSLHVPLIVRFPEKYRSLAADNEGKPGTRTGRLVSFVDFAPTMLSLAGVDIPDVMQGKAFLGDKAAPPRKFVHGFRDRMDERYDMIRCVRDKRFKYIRNFMPHRRYAQHISYMYQMPTMQVWQEMFDAGKLRGAQRAFFLMKPREELYDTQADPHEVNNLAGNPAHVERLRTMRGELRAWMKGIVDLGLLPEADLRSRFGAQPPYDAVRNDPASYPFDRILETSNLVGATVNDRRMTAKDPAVRFWSVIARLSQVEGRTDKTDGRPSLKTALRDTSPDVRVVASAALATRGDADGLRVLADALQHGNEWVRLRAINALDRLDDKARAVRPALRKATKDKNRYVVRVAQKALRDLGR